jgi:hypothetical protein
MPRVPVSHPVTATSPGRPIARLLLELRVTGTGQAALGLACLFVALTATNIPPVRAILPFVVAFVAVGAFSHYNARWLRTAPTPAAAPGVRVEERNLTLRRTLISLILPVVAIGVMSVLSIALAVVLGGIVAGVGAVDLRNFVWVRDRERERNVEIYRELGRSPFSGGKRPLYTRPM